MICLFWVCEVLGPHRTLTRKCPVGTQHTGLGVKGEISDVGRDLGVTGE